MKIVRVIILMISLRLWTEIVILILMIFHLTKNYIKKDEDIIIYDISYKTSMGAKPLHIRFNEADGFIKIHNGIRWLILLDYEWFDKICNRIKYVISKKMVLQITLIIKS